MYTGIFYERARELMHIWDDTKGYYTVPYTRYAYKRSAHGECTSIFGDKLTKVYQYRRDDTSLFESDVPETTRALIDLYGTSDDASERHVVLTLDIECEMESGRPNPMKAENTITAISMHNSATNERRVLILDEKGVLTERNTELTRVIPYLTEKELLLGFLEYYEEAHPTVVTGWNIDKFDTPMLYNRIKRLFDDKQAKRLSPVGLCTYSTHRNRYTFAGVAFLDYIIAYKKYTGHELPNYRLNTVCLDEIGRGKIEYEGNLDQLFHDDIEKYIEYNLNDTDLVVGLEKKLKYLELARSVCHIGHIPYEDFIYSSHYLEGALLTYLRRNNLIAPNKPADGQERMDEMDESGEKGFSGAYVKEPIPGKYEWLYDLDLTALYPSIIMGLNISPETLIGKIDNWDAVEYLSSRDCTYQMGDDTITKSNLKQMLENEHYAIASNGAIYRTDKVGCLPAILVDWFAKRVEYRKLEKKYAIAGDTAQYEFYNKRQLVQKILLNSFYGVTGLPTFRAFNIINAEAVTTTGVTIIKSTAQMANLKYANEIGKPTTLNFPLDEKGNPDYNIYVDTDSVFFSAIPLLESRMPDWRDRPKAEIIKMVDDIAGETQDYLNSFYDMMALKLFNLPKHRFQIKKEFISMSGLWISKKHYAQLIIAENGVMKDTPELDVKGLDVKRSSFPKAFQDIMKQVLIDILYGVDEDIITGKINEFKSTMTDFPVADTAKNTSVKEMSKYIMKGRQPFTMMKGTPAHVKAAIRYNDCLKYFNAAYRYEPMRDGEKLKWVYLRTNPLGMDSLAFKGEDDPKEIMDFINLYIDRTHIFESELHEKLQAFYDAIGWGCVLSQKASASRFFEF